MVAGDCEGGSIYLCGPRIQVASAEGTGIAAIVPDMIYRGFSRSTLALAVPLFKRTL